jgi:hypothetical protein
LALFARRLSLAIPRGLLQLPDYWVHHLALSLLWHHGEAVPLLCIFVFKLVERVVEWIGLWLLPANDSQNGTGFGVTLDFELSDFNNLGGFGDNVQRIGGAAIGGIGARGLCVVQAEEGDCLFLATRCVVEARCEAEAAVVLGEGLFLVPIVSR